MAIGHMKTSQRGIDLIKSFEGFRAQSYKCLATEKYYTIGYGHYGPDVRFAQVITKAQAEDLLRSDIERFEKNVNKYDYTYDFNQNEFDALVSFAYHIGSIDGLTDNGTRSRSVIAEKMLLYVKSGGRTIDGLVKRRKAEHDLFLSSSGSSKPSVKIAVPTLRARCKGDKVKILQTNLNDFFGSGLVIDGIFGAKTKEAVIFAQSALGCAMDGIYGPVTAGKLQALAKERGFDIC